MTAFFKPYQHANQLYLSNHYANVPKAAFMSFAKFNVNQSVVPFTTKDWDRQFTALLTKSFQLPKFKITTETVNQYNRKTNVQTKINYEPITLEMHDDMGETSNGFWKNYYKYFYADSRYGDKSSQANIKAAYNDTKYGLNDYVYGLNYGPNIASKGYASGSPYFLDSIDVYVLHQKNYSQYTLINPIITSWEHDTVAQAEGSKVLSNKLSVVYENVIYNTGKISSADSTGLFEDPSVYDPSVSPQVNSGQEGIPQANLNDFNVTIPQTPQYRPNPVQDKRRGLTAGQLISAASTAQLLLKQPRQAWNVYGFNIKNALSGAAIGAVSASQINLTSNTAPPQQGTVTGVTNLTK